jgi:hypothetical protein
MNEMTIIRARIEEKKKYISIRDIRMRLIRKKSSITIRRTTNDKTGLEREREVVNIFLSSIKYMRNNKTRQKKT